MVVTDMPESGDLDAGRLMSGEVGDLFDRMIGALDLDRTNIYCAPLCPGRPPTGRIDHEWLPELGRIALHHIKLAAPKRVWLLGQATSRAILGTDEAMATGKIQLINQDDSIMEAVATIHPRLLLTNPSRKAGVWKDMQLLAGGLVA